MAEDIEWFLGRDGQQYGPIKNEEIATLVRLGQLRTTDLVWRHGMPDWLPAFDALGLPPPGPDVEPETPAAPEPRSPPEPEVHADSPPVAEAHSAPVAPPPPPATTPLEHPGIEHPKADHARGVREPVIMPPPAEIDVGPSDVPPPVAHPVEQRDERGALEPAPIPDPPDPIPTLADLNDALRSAPEPRLDRSTAVARTPETAFLPRPEPVKTPQRASSVSKSAATGPKRKRRVAGVVIVSTLALAGAGGVYYFWDAIAAGTLALTQAPVADPVPAPRAEVPRVATAEPPRPEFARAPVWGYVSSEFPEWYAERMREAGRLNEQRQDQAAVAKYLTESLVSLRRNHSGDALSASHGRITAIATAFVANLDTLKAQSIDACYEFISHGESSEAVLQRLGDKTVSTAIDAQLEAVFDAVREGRRKPVAHMPPRKGDYDVLADELVKLGWTDADLKTFSDPRQLSLAAPDVVCRLVRDWFRAHLAVADQNIQLRLLIESLKPVVAG